MMNKRKYGRTFINCGRCHKTTLNFGLNMCSACLRRTKRETKPSFYLGTCFSEMNRRVKHLDVLRPNYVGKQICTKEEFFNKFLNDSQFLSLYKSWQESGFMRRESPSIDRINNNGDYLINNLQFIKHTENTGKDSHSKKGKPFKHLKIIDSNGVTYKSLTDCAHKNNVSRGNLRKYLELNRELNGKTYKKL